MNEDGMKKAEKGLAGVRNASLEDLVWAFGIAPKEHEDFKALRGVRNSIRHLREGPSDKDGVIPEWAAFWAWRKQLSGPALREQEEIERRLLADWEREAEELEARLRARFRAQLGGMGEGTLS